MKRNRLTDADINLGPITIGAYDKRWRPIGVVIKSGNDEYPGCSLYFYTGWRTIRVALPAIIKPWKRWVDTSKYDWGKPGSGYWEMSANEYGFMLTDGDFFRIFFGPQTGDSLTEKLWCTHLPWTQWRHVRTSYYDNQGKHFWTEPKSIDFRARLDKKQDCPVVKFEIEDYDGTRVIASTRIEEREWLFGEKWCSWLSFFRKPKIRRSLWIDFDKEVGKGKGSWKGGTVGCGIDMLPGELHADAFRRFCEKEMRHKYGKSQVKFIAELNGADALWTK